MKQPNRKLRRYIWGAAFGVICLGVVGTSARAAETDPLDGLNAGAAVYLEGSADLASSESEQETAVADAAGNAGEQEADTQESSELSKERLVMANVENAVNVRAEADEEAEVVGKLFENCGGEILEREGGWTKLKSGNVEGWTKDDYLLFGEEAAALRETAGTLQATVLTDALRVRKEADAEAGVYGLVKSGDTLEVLEQDEEWVTVQYDEDTVGYISAEFADVEYVIPSGKTTKEIADEERAKELAKLSKNQGAVPTSVSDVQLLAALIQCEAGSQSYEGKLAVGAAVMNRVRSGGFPNTIVGVITAPGQFPPATNGKVASVAASGPSAACMQAAQAAVDGATNIGSATHFNRVGSHAGIVVGSHVFW